MKFSRSITLSLAGLAVVAALSGCGSTSNPLGVDQQQLDTTPPPAPVNLTLSHDASGNPILVWDASAALDVAGYQVQVYSASAGGFVSASDPSSFDTSFPIPDVNNSVMESYRVRAVDTSGNWSAYSSTANVLVPAAGQPTPIGIN